MENKKLGWVLIVLSLLMIVALIFVQSNINHLVNDLMDASGGFCVNDEGECIHEASNLPMTIGYVISALIMALGIYLVFFSKSEKAVLSKIKEIDTKTKEDEKFELILKGLSVDEKKILRVVKEQDGIEQNTLRIRTDMSKTKLSLVLSELDKKELIKKVPKGKTNQVFLKIGI
ncbi:MAG: hypothetical protein ABIH25_03040 [Candidatus Woesearchaeota archaeon]